QRAHACCRDPTGSRRLWPVPQRARVALPGRSRQKAHRLPTMSMHEARIPGGKATHRPWSAAQPFRVAVRRIVAVNCQGDVDVTSIESGPSWVERLNPRHWTLVWKLVIVGLVPALLALALGVLRIADQAGSAADLGRSGRLLEARNEIVAASGALRLERDQATLYAASNGKGDRAALDSSRQRSDQVVNRYTNVIGTIDVLDRAILRQQRTQATAGLADASSAVTSASEQLSIQHAILSGAIRAGKPLPGDPAVVNAATAQLVNNYRDYQAALTPEQLAEFGNLPDTSATSRMDQLRSAILTAPFQLGPLARDWDTAYDQARESTDRTAGLISAELSATAAAAASAPATSRASTPSSSCSACSSASRSRCWWRAR